MKVEPVISQTRSSVINSVNDRQRGRVQRGVSSVGTAEKPEPGDLRKILSPEEKHMLATLFGPYQKSPVSYNLKAQPLKQVETGLKIDATA